MASCPNYPPLPFLSLRSFGNATKYLSGVGRTKARGHRRRGASPRNRRTRGIVLLGPVVLSERAIYTSEVAIRRDATRGKSAREREGGSSVLAGQTAPVYRLEPVVRKHSKTVRQRAK